MLTPTGGLGGPPHPTVPAAVTTFTCFKFLCQKKKKISFGNFFISFAYLPITPPRRTRPAPSSGHRPRQMSQRPSINSASELSDDAFSQVVAQCVVFLQDCCTPARQSFCFQRKPEPSRRKEEPSSSSSSFSALRMMDGA